MAHVIAGAIEADLLIGLPSCQSQMRDDRDGLRAVNARPSPPTT
jgi:hypothetical protein